MTNDLGGMTPHNDAERGLLTPAAADISESTRARHRARLRSAVRDTIDAGPASPAGAAEPAPGPTRSWPRRAAAATALAAVAAAALVIAAVALGRGPQPPPTTVVGCFATGTVDATSVAAVTTSIEATGSTEQADAAIRACSVEWSKGRVAGPPAEPSRTPTPPGTTSYPVPDLTACRMPDGSLAVLPGTSTTCRRLGLPPV